jgi:hypothetical protein
MNAGTTVNPKLAAVFSIKFPISQNLRPGLQIEMASFKQISVVLTRFLPKSSTFPIKKVLEQSP